MIHRAVWCVSIDVSGNSCEHWSRREQIALICRFILPEYTETHPRRHVQDYFQKNLNCQRNSWIFTAGCRYICPRYQLKDTLEMHLCCRKPLQYLDVEVLSVDCFCVHETSEGSLLPKVRWSKTDGVEVHSNAHNVIAGFFLSHEPEVT
jgi:hypothetical protein